MGSARLELQREVEIHKSLEHPHIVRFEHIYESPEDVRLVMEHMEGGELFDVLDERGQFTEEQVAQTMAQVLQAVAYLHERRIAHRDIKLENILRHSKTTDVFKLADFGLATFVEAEPLRRRCGTLQFIAPEVLGECYTENADLWSVGAVAYVLLTGLALYGGDENAVKNKIRVGQLDWSKRFALISEDAQSFVHSFLVVDPNKRLSAADGLKHAWLLKHGSTTPTTAMSGPEHTLCCCSNKSESSCSTLVPTPNSIPTGACGGA